jgi:two-component system NtrC family sensor kinase
MSLDEVDSEIEMSTMKVGVFALTTIAVTSLIISFFVNRWVSRRLNTLLDATVQVGNGNLNYSIKDLGRDDLGMLARSFNTMTQKLSEARLQLFQSDKMASLGRLAAGVAHEINNPLTGVLTYSSFLLKRTKDNPELHNDLGVIVRETIRSREIVKSLLDFARQSVPKKSLTDLNEVLSHAIGVVENQLNLRGVRLTRNLSPDLPQVTVDANQMQQVFINLLVNACDAIQNPGGTITLTSRRVLLSPFGNTQIRKATCSRGHSLIDNEYRINGMPSVKMSLRFEGKQGALMRDPVYGMNRDHCSISIPEKAEVSLSCPQCGVSLMQESRPCPVCGAQTYAIFEPSDGEIEACSRRGCDWQQWRSLDEGGQRQYVEVNVSDTGTGIPAEDLPRIFEPFFTTKGQKGTGLGLAVIWGIINNHDGTITVESNSGKGTTFSIRIPVT